MLNITELKTKDCIEPLGISPDHVTFSWVLESDIHNTCQVSYHIIVKNDQDKVVWDSGIQESGQSVYIPYGGLPLNGQEVYFWSVCIRDNNEETATANSAFETAPLQNQLIASWIETDLPEATKEPKDSVFRIVFPSPKKGDPEKKLRPPTYFRKEFELGRKPIKARLYASAHGFYIPYANGRKIGDRLMAPEFTAYKKNILFQTYDITNILTIGKNVYGAIVADGWWCGRISASGTSCFYGNKHALWSQITVWYEDGTSENFVTDELVSFGTGAYIYSDFFIGEKYDSRRNCSEWCTSVFAETWPLCHCADYDTTTLFPQESEPVRVIKKFQPVKVFRSPKGETIVDLGQNIHGMLTTKINAPKGTTIIFEHSEVLDNAGNFVHSVHGANKDHKDVYICSGKKDEEYTPSFAFHGFRYARITGLNGITIDDVVANVIASDNEDTAWLTTSNELLNRLLQNIYWSQIGNFASIPTDCPQRERGGYTGDLEVFIDTATLLQDNRRFLFKWLKDLRLEQRDNGSVQDRIPLDSAIQFEHDGMVAPMQGVAGWGDAAVIVPYKVYQRYGDVQILQDQYESMKRWTNYVENRAKENPKKILRSKVYKKNPEYRELMHYLWNTGIHYGDWMSPTATINGDIIGVFKHMLHTREIFASGYFANTVRLMEETAKILGKKEDESYYHDLLQNIKKAFAVRYFDEDGALKCQTQGAYVMALSFELVPLRWKEKAITTLIGMIKENNGCLDTGFLSIGLIMDVLSDNGRLDEAYKLLYQEKCPSWLYEVKHGATTMWESWNNIVEGKEPGKLSYNHYAFGCIGDWIYRKVGGLELVSPGYKKFIINPLPDDSLTHADMTYKSIYGDIKIRWQRMADKATLDVVIPCNTTAEIRFMGKNIGEYGSGGYHFDC